MFPLSQCWDEQNTIWRSANQSPHDISRGKMTPLTFTCFFWGFLKPSTIVMGKNLKSRWDPQFLRVDLCWFPLLWLVWGSVFRGASPASPLSSAQTVAICKQLNDSWISGDGSTLFFGDEELMKNLRSISKDERGCCDVVHPIIINLQIHMDGINPPKLELYWH